MRGTRLVRGRDGRGPMTRPTTKATLLEAADTQFTKLWDLIDSMSAAEQESVFDFSADVTKKEAHWARDTCLRDVLGHLHGWHQLLLAWVGANQTGESRPFLPEPYTWRTYGQMNVELCRKYEQTSLAQAKQLLLTSHDEIVRLIKRFSDDELFEKSHFDWTGTTTLGSYCVSTTSSHYEWAIKKLRAHLKRARLTS